MTTTITVAAHERAAVEGKSAWWNDNHLVHGAGRVDGPFVNGDQFAVFWEIDVTPKATGERTRLREVALYTIRNDKIAEERFFYGGA